jgi:enoyl-CoA hydratase/carnithine racemase
LAVATAKRALREGADLSPSEAMVVEAELFAGLFRTADLRTGTRAFLDKVSETPPWQGR